MSDFIPGERGYRSGERGWPGARGPEGVRTPEPEYRASMAALERQLDRAEREAERHNPAAWWALVIVLILATLGFMVAAAAAVEVGPAVGYCILAGVTTGAALRCMIASLPR